MKNLLIPILTLFILAGSLYLAWDKLTKFYLRQWRKRITTGDRVFVNGQSDYIVSCMDNKLWVIRDNDIVSVDLDECKPWV